MLLKNSIQTGFGGFGLIATIKEANETVTNLSDLMTVKVDAGDAIALLILYAGVVHCPILTIGDGSVHQAFDLTHLGAFRLVCFSIARIGGHLKRSCATCQTVTSSTSSG